MVKLNRVSDSALLAATNDLMLQSQALTSTEVFTNKNSGWKLGVGIGVSDSAAAAGASISSLAAMLAAATPRVMARLIAKPRSARATT